MKVMLVELSYYGKRSSMAEEAAQRIREQVRGMTAGCNPTGTLCHAVDDIDNPQTRRSGWYYGTPQSNPSIVVTFVDAYIDTLSRDCGAMK